eukprot:TRINITY_DN553_c0_g1_i3.p1 TRINITY_DN553_c0_g1~~TRINITY_DN553_c0_g1_i3.p1  ORF type:complete len:308 (-),score=23.22 TRINITY_DN553_c0_g1_i3:201-1124(-)
MLDTDDNGDLTFTEFVNGLYSLKNENEHTFLLFTKHYCETMFEMFPDIVAMLDGQSIKLNAQDRQFDNVLRKRRMIRFGSVRANEGDDESASTSEVSRQKSGDSDSLVAAALEGRPGGEMVKSETLNSQISQNAVECELNQSTWSRSCSGSSAASAPAEGVEVKSVQKVSATSYSGSSQASGPAEGVEVKSVQSVNSTAGMSVQEVSATSYSGSSPASGPAEGVEVKSVQSVNSTAGIDTGMANAEAGRQQVITHAPVGRRPWKGKRSGSRDELAAICSFMAGQHWSCPGPLADHVSEHQLDARRDT